jgi:hypothetical protein
MKFMREPEILHHMELIKREMDLHEEVIEDSRNSWLKKLSIYQGLLSRLKEIRKENKNEQN